MEHQFWHDKWQRNQLGFHEGTVNALLASHLDAALPAPGARLFLPLCGKTADIGWLINRGYRIAGAELSELAVQQLFDVLQLAPRVHHSGDLHHYQAPGIDIFAGDIFALDAETLGPVDAIYDRAALVALPQPTRQSYARHLTRLTAAAPMLLISFDYDQSALAGPPFSVPEAEITSLYTPGYKISKLGERWIPGKLKTRVEALEQAWLLQPNA